MLKSIMIYSTVDGQTLSICNKLKLALEESGELVTLVSIVEAKSLPLTDFDKVLIGASIRYGKHRPELYKFIKENMTVLSSMKSAFFTVNVVARKPLKNTPETNPYMQKFLQLSQWQPNLLGVFAGKIDYPKYRTLDRVMIRFIMWMTKGPTDITGTYEFTDWDRVDEFANDFSQI
ncbi:menaquinone-dependent protoporphyrinogen IX dehydrogenase [Shewanella donghaensis]|uniref:menaquinone-dependent protoporphyrinogen IX dehydrogenase n=1 Tax=Shewanella donghaensis TaxID=238836 RepID=UPI001183F25E|nr:menaquinone-dependent protoporphyrinogen IX dehydrogenase [Shewanella donghaensis]